MDAKLPASLEVPPYETHSVERRWRERWAAAGCFQASEDPERPRFYNFDGGPFPNGPLHIGHVRTFTLGDVLARFQRMRGKNVLYCFEFDAFGLPNELAAQARGMSPEELTRANIQRQRAQMERLGLSYDWRHVHVTCDPRYYRWTQYLFLKLYERGLIYRGSAELNWCGTCGTTLAHMQVVDGLCWRCDSPAERRTLTQWFVRLSAYSEVLAERFGTLEGWSDQVKRLLAGFLARTPGFEVDFEVEGRPGQFLTAFLKERQALANASCLVAAVGNAQLAAVLPSSPRAAQVQEYVTTSAAQAGQRLRRRSGGADAGEDEISRLDTGLRVRHPLSGALLPVFVSRRVDPWFATGIEVGGTREGSREPPGAGEGSPECLRPVVHYRVHDWLVSRQRTWGTPIPIIRCEGCGEVPVPESELPVLLPAWEPALAASGSLGNFPTFVNASCPRCGRPARRETDTLDCYFDVVWCFLACSSQLGPEFSFRREDFAAWSPVDWFHNGVDSFFYAHLYRFIGQVLFEMGLLPQPEPIRHYHGHDAVLAGGRKMSKHHGTAVSPDELLERFGADILRVHVLWSASPLKKVEWSDAGMRKAERLLAEVWALIAPRTELIRHGHADGLPPEPSKLGRMVERSLRRVTAFIESYRASGCLEEISLLLPHLARFAEAEVDREASPEGVRVFVSAVRTLVLMLAPFAPHLCEELWERIGGEGLVATAAWPLPEATR